MLKKISKIFLLILFSNELFANEFELISQKYPEIALSVLVKDVSSGKVMFDHNSEKLMIPASSLKLFTGYLALTFLGREYQYKTELSRNKNSLYLKFNGDPSLAIDDLEHLFNKIKDKSKITKIYVDDTFFDDDYYGKGWAWDDIKFCYSAPVSAIIIDNNCFTGQINQKANVKTKAYAKIINNLKQDDDPSCLLDLRAYPNNSYEFKGCVGKYSDSISLSVAYQNPRILLTNILQKKFKIKNVEFKKMPEDSLLIAKHTSAPLNQLVKKMLKESNNIYAESFFKTIGANYFRKQGSFNLGRAALRKLLPDFKFKIVDGSGVSRYNLVSAKDFVDLLIMASENTDFRDSLPVAGVDGTLEPRLKSFVSAEEKIIAKTGSMNGINCLAGYIGNNYAFSIMINNFTFSAKVAEEIQETILKKIMIELEPKLEVVDN